MPSQRFHRSLLHILIAGSTLVASASAALGQCDPAWSDRFALRGVQGVINTATTWNDGTGPKVYAAGDFSAFDDIPSVGSPRGANSIAAWNGTRWSKLGLGIGGTAPGQGGLRIVHALAAFDPDGSGPAPESLYVGGEFNWAGGQNIIGIARWDGTAWHDVGGGIFGLSTTLFNRLGVRGMAVFDPDGPGPQPAELYVAGDFEFAGTEFVNGVARWNGTQWQSVGGSFPSGTSGQKLTVFDPDGPGPQPAELYLGGRFSFVPDGLGGFISSRGLARWNGTSWTDEPGIDLSGVEALAVFDDGSTRELWVSGTTTSPNGHAIARRTAGSWVSFGAPGTFTHLAFALQQFGGHMFISRDGAIASDLQRWSPAQPTDLTTVGSTLRGKFRTLAVVDLDFAGPQPAKLLVAGGENFHRFTALHDPVAGDQAFTNAAVWNGSSFEPTPTVGSTSLGLGIPTNGYPTSVWTMRALDADGAGPQPPRLFVGGVFNGAGPTVTANAAAFDGTSFSALPFWVNTGNGFPTILDFDDSSYPTVLDFAVTTDGGTTSLFASSQDIGSGAGIYRWDGARFYPIGFPDAGVRRILGFDDGTGMALWAFGTGDITVHSFLGMPGNSISSGGAARWRPTTGWEPAGEGIPAQGFSIRDVAVYDSGTGPTLFAGGFTFNSPQRFLARWTGSMWDFSPITSLGGDFAIIGSLRAFNGDLYAAGSFTSVNGVPAVGIARWNGTTWSALGSGLSDAENGPASVRVSSMAVHDDGTGPALYVSGSFTHAGGVAAMNIARWNGTAWSSAGPPNASGGWSADAMASFDGGLYIGGGFLTWDGKPAAGITMLRQSCIPCPTDFNGDGVTDPDDLSDFIACYFAMPACAAADFNADGTPDPDDLSDFIAAYFTSCP